jgi:hypothetical protein
MPGLLAFSSFEFLNVIDGISAEEAACCFSILWMTCLYVQHCGGRLRVSACMRVSASAFGACLHDVLYAGYPLYIVDTAEERNG